MGWCTQGSKTYRKRKELFEHRLAAIEEEIAELSRMRDLLKYKSWYYEQAVEDGSEDRVQTMLPDKLPKGIQELYDSGFRH